MVSFFIPGKPRATQTGSVVRVRGRAFPIRRNTSWSSYCGLVAATHSPETPLEGPIDVSLLFWLPRPKGKKRDLPSVRPDVENLAKGLLDQFSGILWRDDAQIVDLRLAKRYADASHPVGLEVTVLLGN